ncbi:Emi1 protein [Maudiozyma humilis]|uniref:Emi1 protein n=1 Tax=Maudiozyma humilis TaxID=51915 RepID=A0AAV5S5G9_MAUHU|nr:Emi1 protein [Kazachstania humilis]
MSGSKYPTTMSCMEAFNRLTTCYSLGGQFRSYYRVGHLNPCDRQLEKLKFCVWSGKDPVAVQQWYRAEAERNLRVVGSSEAIWQERE